MVFTDLVGSTELRVRLGEAVADELRRTHDALLAEAIASHGGTVVKGLGDGIMATFDSATQAVGGAVAVQQAAELHGRRHPEHAFGIRVGMSIGDVSAEGGDVFGVPVVEASRLCAIAAAGEILAADLVRALARGRGDVVFESMGELDLKGLPEPVAACRVAWVPVIETSGGAAVRSAQLPAPLLGAATAYIGREDLRAQLDQAWRDAVGGSARTVLLAGEPGVGKTRTAAEVARVAFGDSALVLYGRCDEDLAVPYQPFVEALEHHARHTPEPVFGRLPGELTRLVPDLAAVVADLPVAVRSDPASEEYRLFEAVSSWLIDAAGQTGLVLILDDIHWATKPTLQLMQHLVRGAGDEHAKLLVLATYRDTDIDRAHPLAGTLGDLRRLPGVSRIAVENLGNHEVLTFIETAAGHELDGPIRAVAQAIYAETEGNPFFVGEVLRHLIETGAVRREGERWVVADGGQVTVPEGVRDVVGRRLNRLSDTANDVLSVAAVIGRDFDVDTLMAVVDAGEDAALDALDAAVRARLVEETGVDRFRFAHALVRTTLYEELSATRRRRLHRRVADALEKLRPDDVRALAHHCIQGGAVGGDIGRALHYALASAEQSLAARAFADAEAGFRSALELLEDAPDTAEADLIVTLCGLGAAQRDQGDPAFRDTLLDASARAATVGDARLLARAVLANTRGFASVIGDVDPERIGFIEQALERTSPQPSAVRARLLSLLASEITFSGDHDRRIALSDDAIRMARELDDPDLMGEVLATTAYAVIDSPSWPSLIGSSDEAVRLADAGGDPTRMVTARIFHSSALLTAGRLDESARVLRTAIALAATDAAPTVRWTANSNDIRLTVFAGELDDADAQSLAVLEEGRRLGQRDAEQWWAATAVGVLWLRGQVGNLADAAEDFTRQYPLSRIWRVAQAWLLGEAGRVDEGRAVVAAHQLDPLELLDEPWPFVGTFQLGMAAWYLGDADLGARVVAALRPYRGCWAHYYLFVLGPVSWALGVGASLSGALDDAVEYLDEALADLTAHGCIAYLPSLRLHLAQTLRRRGGPGDAGRAAAELTVARAEAQQVGAGGVLDRIDAERA